MTRASADHSLAPGGDTREACHQKRLQEAVDAPDNHLLADLFRLGEPASILSTIEILLRHGTLRHASVIATALRDPDPRVVEAAEYCLWTIWMQAGSPDGNEQLALASDFSELGYLKAAREVLHDLRRTEPDFAEAHHQYGIVAALLNRTDDATRAFHRTTQLIPCHFSAWAALGHLHTEMGDFQTALSYYRRAARIYPRLDGLPEAMDRLTAVLDQGTESRPN